MEPEKAIWIVEQIKGTYDMDSSQFYDALDIVLRVAKEHQKPQVSPSNSSDLLNAELYEALDEWFKSLDLLMKLNGCILSELIGSCVLRLSSLGRSFIFRPAFILNV